MSSGRTATPPSNLEKATLWHVAIFVIGAAWMFGGRIDWAQNPLIIWGMVGAALTLMGFIDRRQRGAPTLRWGLWLLPAGLGALWVLVSSFNPNMEVVWFYEREVYRPRDPIPWLPSAAVPELTQSELMLRFGLWLGAFNLALNIQHRRTLRRLTLILGLNAVVLAIFGTLQKLLGTDIFFGLQTSPNNSFFASFIYHNHWGPFALLNIAGWFGLTEYLSRHDRGRGFSHSPALFALMAVVLLAVTLPLSTSRSSTAMMLLLVPICSLWLVWRFGAAAARPRSRGITTAVAVIGLLGCGTAAYWLGGDTIRQRLTDTREQITAMREMGGIGQRARLYQDTWRMAMDRPGGGWGLESYATMYRRYSTEPKTVEGWTVQFNEAHSDWLQLFAEVGFVGAGLVVLTVAIPLWALRHRLWTDPYAGAPFLCLGLLVTYAWVEFPFANPAVTLSAWVAFYGALRYLQLGKSTRPHPSPSAS